MSSVLLYGMVHTNVGQKVLKHDLFNTFLDDRLQVFDATICLSDA